MTHPIAFHHVLHVYYKWGKSRKERKFVYLFMFASLFIYMFACVFIKLFIYSLIYPLILLCLKSIRVEISNASKKSTGILMCNVAMDDSWFRFRHT
jgi:hypothetical protein